MNNSIKQNFILKSDLSQIPSYLKNILIRKWAQINKLHMPSQTQLLKIKHIIFKNIKKKIIIHIGNYTILKIKDYIFIKKNNINDKT